MNTQEQTPAVYTGCERAAFAPGPEALGDRAMTAFQFDKAAQYYSSAAAQCGGHSKAERMKSMADRALLAHAAPAMYEALQMIEEDEQDLINGRMPRHGFRVVTAARNRALAAARKGGAL